MLFSSVQKTLFPIGDFRFLFHIKNYNFLLLLYPLFSHLTSCTPIKSNLYLDNFLAAAAAVSEPALNRPLTFQEPNLAPIFRCLGRRKLSVQIRGLLYECFVTGYVLAVMSR